MSHTKQRQSTGATNLSQILASEARLNRLHRLFKTHYNVTEPSLILEPYLFLGNCIAAHDINRLSKLGIRYILNVAIRDVELCPYYSDDIRTFTIDLRDDDRENILRIFDQAFAFIDEAKRDKSRILVHCSHGQSRSPAIVIGYLMRTYNTSLEQCLIHVIKARPCVLPNDGFLKQLILYDRFLVERRRRREEAALPETVDNTSPTEIPIQHKSSVASQSVQSTTPIILDPPQYPDTKETNATSISSVDSSSLEQTSTFSIQTSISADSIHVIPIQIPSKVTRREKIEPVPIKKVSNGDVSVVKEKKRNVKQLKEKAITTDLITVLDKSNREVVSSNHAASPRRRQSVLITSIDKQSSSQKSRSQSARHDRRQINHYSPSSSNKQQRNPVTYYPTNHRTSAEPTRTKYITEIYDKATNRYIPTSW